VSYLIFFEQSGAMADKIRALDGGKFSHVALILPGGREVVDSTPTGGVAKASLFQRMKESDGAIVRTLDMEYIADPASLLGIPYDDAWVKGKIATPPMKLHCATLMGHIFGIAGPRHPNLSLSEIYALTQAAHQSIDA